MTRTSRLDQILSDTALAIAKGVVTAEWKNVETKEQIKLLFLEVIDQFNKETDPIKIIEGLEKAVEAL